MKYKTLAEFTATKQRMSVRDFENQYGESIDDFHVDNVLVYTHGLHIECIGDSIIYIMRVNNKDWNVYGEENLDLLEAKLYNYYQEWCKTDGEEVVDTIGKFTLREIYDFVEKVKPILKDFYGWTVDYVEEIEIRNEVLWVQVNINNEKTPGIWVTYDKEKDYISMGHDFPKDFMQL